LHLADRPEEDRAAVKSIAEQKLIAIRQNISDLKKAESTLSDLVKQCSGEGPVQDCPIIEAFVDGEFRGDRNSG
jgi:hypothetical protein